jgi:hypothetical protein
MRPGRQRLLCHLAHRRRYAGPRTALARDGVRGGAGVISQFSHPSGVRAGRYRANRYSPHHERRIPDA